MHNDLLNILWVENDPEVLTAYPLEAEIHGLNLHAFDCWDDALDALKSDYNKWDAIILDAKCKHHKDSADNAARFLIEVSNSLTRLYSEKKRQLNWYILSGGSEHEISDLIPDEREKWDGDWTKKFYSKNTDREMLYMRIRHHVKHSDSTHLKTVLYRPVFEAIKNAGIDEEVELLMTDLLMPMHYEEIDNLDYNNRLNTVRKVIEYVFRSMVGYAILPESFYIGRSGKKEMNLSWSSLFLSGKPDAKSNVVVHKVIFPKVLGDNIKNMIFGTGAYVHTEDKEQDNTQRIHEYLKMTGESTYLIRSYALQLCDFILWYNSYLKQNPNIEENRKNWSLI